MCACTRLDGSYCCLPVLPVTLSGSIDDTITGISESKEHFLGDQVVYNDKAVFLDGLIDGDVVNISEHYEEIVFKRDDKCLKT